MPAPVEPAPALRRWLERSPDPGGHSGPGIWDSLFFSLIRGSLENFFFAFLWGEELLRFFEFHLKTKVRLSPFFFRGVRVRLRGGEPDAGVPSAIVGKWDEFVVNESLTNR